MPSKRGILFQPKATEDLELIFEYTESNWGYKQADKYIDRIYSSLIQLLIYPELGIKYVSNSTEYRKLLVDKHIIYYRISKTNILIVRILHSKMNRDNLIK